MPLFISVQKKLCEQIIIHVDKSLIEINDIDYFY